MNSFTTAVLVIILSFGLGMVLGLMVIEKSAADLCGSQGSFQLIIGVKLTCSISEEKGYAAGKR